MAKPQGVRHTGRSRRGAAGLPQAGLPHGALCFFRTVVPFEMILYLATLIAD